MGRLLRLTERYARTYSALRLSSGERRAVAAAMTELERSGRLPGQTDFEALLPFGVGVAWARQVRGFQLWVLYRFDDREVTLRALADREPLRVDE